MQFSCDSCKAQLQIADEKVRGKRLRVRCRRCGALIALADPSLPKSAPRVVSAPPAAAAPAAPAPSSAPSPPAGGAPAAAAPEARRSDVEITRAMETATLERALQASAEGAPQNGATAPQAPAAPAEPAADGPIWFAMLHGKQTGPLTRAELDARANDGEVGPRTYLWREGMDSWQRAKDVAELGSMFPQFPGSLLPPLQEAKTPPAAAPVPAPQQERTPAPPPQAPAPVRQAPPPVPQAPPPSQPPAPALKQPSFSQPSFAQTSEPAPSSQVWQMGEGAAASDLEEPVPALPPERGPAEVARELFASGEHSISQKNALDLARWATDEMDRKKGGQEHARMVPPVIAPSMPVFEAASPKKGKGALIAFVVLAALGIVVLVLWILLGGSPDRPEESRPDPAARTQQSPAVPAQPPPAQKPAETLSPAAQGRASEPASQPPPSVPAAGLTGEQVRRKLDEAKPSLQGCIDDALRRDPKLRVGKIHLAATIAPNGQVTAAKIDKRTVDESALGTCLKRSTRRLLFPPFNGPAFDVDIPIVVTAGD